MTTEQEAQEEMDRLVTISQKGRGQLVDVNRRVYTPTNPFPVQAGPGRIIKGSLKRLPGQKSYGAGESIASTVIGPDGAPNAGVIFPDVTRFSGGGSGVILGGKVTKTNTSVAASFRIWLYQRAFPLVPSENDGEPLQIRWGRRDDRLGYLDFDTFVSGFNCAESLGFIGVSQSLLFGMPMNSNTLFGLVQTKVPYVADSEEQIDFYVHVSQD